MFETSRSRFRNKEKLKQKIGERSVLFLSTFQAPTVHAVLGEVAKTSNKNWRAFCAVLALKLEPTLTLSPSLSLPSLADFGPTPLPMGYTHGPLQADTAPTQHLGAMCGR